MSKPYTKKEYDRVNGSFDLLLGRLAGFLGPDVDLELIEDDLLEIVIEHAGDKGREFANKRRAAR